MAPKGSSSNAAWSLTDEDAKPDAAQQRQERPRIRALKASASADQAAEAEAARNIRVAAHEKFGNVNWLITEG